MSNYLKHALSFLKNRPNKLVAFIAILLFVVVLYYLSRNEMLLFAGIGLAGGLFSWIQD